MSDNSGDNLSI